MLKVVDQKFLDELNQKAQESPRKRAHYTFHESNEADIHRFFISMEPETYVKPHRHLGGRWELITLLRGSALFLFLSDDGTVEERLLLSKETGNVVFELDENKWHTVVSLEPGTVVMEVKKGPYAPPTPETVAAWAPTEGDPECAEFMEKCKNAKKGDKLA